MPLEGKVVAGRAEAREERLRAFLVAEAAYVPFAFSSGLTAVLGAVVDRALALTNACFVSANSGASGLDAAWPRNRPVTLLRGAVQERSARWKPRLPAALSRRFCSRMSSSELCSSTVRHSSEGSPCSVTNTSSRCQVLPGLRRATLTRWRNWHQVYCTSSRSSRSRRPRRARTAVP